MTKTKTISLNPGFRGGDMKINDPLGYRVERVTDSLEFTPGDIITKAKAEELCAARDWKVTVARKGT